MGALGTGAAYLRGRSAIAKASGVKSYKMSPIPGKPGTYSAGPGIPHYPRDTPIGKTIKAGAGALVSDVKSAAKTGAGIMSGIWKKTKKKVLGEE